MVILSDDAVVAAGIVHDLVMPANELVGLVALAIERSNDLFVFAGYCLSSICHRQFRFDLDIASLPNETASDTPACVISTSWSIRVRLRGTTRNGAFGGRLCG